MWNADLKTMAPFESVPITWSADDLLLLSKASFDVKCVVWHFEWHVHEFVYLIAIFLIFPNAPNTLKQVWINPQMVFVF